MTPPSPYERTALGRLAAFAFRRRGLVLLAWLAAAVGAFALGSAVAGDYSADYSTPGSESKAAATVLQVDAAALAQWLRPVPGQRLEDHLYVVDPQGHWMMRFPANIDPARAKRDLDRLLRASSAWDKPGRESTPGG